MAYPKARGGMGFRDLHAFNMAMVAKQGWNIMTSPNTLVKKVYKARYFPNSSLFDCHLGNNSSYVWRSIWKSRQILMNECRWSIEMGTNIKVMKEPWQREKDGIWVHLPQVQSAYNITVDQLMVPNVKMWDKEKIESLFSVDVACCILNTTYLMGLRRIN
ncbi:unnamed protein product [Trifolium pratense]|uniref:Uncharacterized protein n=1 Tax=Trifolium pratense TaxID=57577 RepID=A0ACB0MBK9_TRIPR|nr:unnamed protein product [Trifolium pratense]